MLVQELAAFLQHRDVMGWVLLATMIFFSSLAFKVLENAIPVIFLHRVEVRHRHFLVSMLLPFAYIAFIGAGLFAGTLVLAQLIAIGEERLVILGHTWSLDGFSRFVLYLAGVAGEILIISAIYLFMPVGRISMSHALIGGAVSNSRNWRETRKLSRKRRAVSSHAADSFGTFMLVFMGFGSIFISDKYPVAAPWLIPAAFGGTVVLMIVTVGQVSGAHLNPAVTLAFAVSKRIPLAQVPGYWTSQCAGGLAASFLLEAIKKI